MTGFTLREVQQAIVAERFEKWFVKKRGVGTAEVYPGMPLAFVYDLYGPEFEAEGGRGPW